ncbi:MAG: LysR substrate-binding domain-containing protein [Rickettsiales bacterium]|nr:LysR substrate-binding domain-containing protein [Rickettsiales bacterium]
MADLKNFSKAAEQCHISQPTLSAQIKKLEEYLNIQIFERSNRQVMLTAVGEEIILKARKILQLEEDIFTLAKDAHEPFAGELHLGAFPTLASYYYPEIIPEIRKNFPNLTLLLHEEKTEILLSMLKDGKIDAAFIALPILDDAFVWETIFEDPFYLIVPKDHELGRASKIDMKVISQYSPMLLDEGHCLRDQALEVCHAQGASEAAFRATSLETLREMVKAGSGITLMPEIALRDNSDTKTIPFREPVPSRTIALVWRKTSARKQLMHALSELLKELRS